MTVKDKKPKVKKVILVLIGLAMPLSLIIGAVLAFKKSSANKEKLISQMQKIHIKELNDVKSHEYDLTCDGKVIKKDSFRLAKINDNYRIFVGDDVTDLKNTYKLSNCDIIYFIDK